MMMQNGGRNKTCALKQSAPSPNKKMCFDSSVSGRMIRKIKRPALNKILIFFVCCEKVVQCQT